MSNIEVVIVKELGNNMLMKFFCGWHQCWYVCQRYQIVVVRGVGVGVVRGVDDELGSNVVDEVGEEVKVELRGKCLSINMSNMDSMWTTWHCLLTGLVNPGVVTS